MLKERQWKNLTSLWKDVVLILILMEHAQRAYSRKRSRVVCCLNPYFNGTCSKSSSKVINARLEQVVLILILMEHAQRADYNAAAEGRKRVRLNPYFNGTCSKRAFFIRPSVLICYIGIFTLINAFASEKCTCFLLKTLQR